MSLSAVLWLPRRISPNRSDSRYAKVRRAVIGPPVPVNSRMPPARNPLSSEISGLNRMRESRKTSALTGWALLLGEVEPVPVVAVKSALVVEAPRSSCHAPET
jgi:hypothetical protein